MVQCDGHDRIIGKLFDKIDDLKDRSSQVVDDLKSEIHVIDKNITAYQASTDIKLDFIVKNMRRSTIIPALNNINWNRMAKGIGIVIGVISAAIGSYYAATASPQLAIVPPAQMQQLERDTDTAIKTVWNDGDERETLNQ